MPGARPTAIAGLLGRPASGGPEAELWIGAHPDSPSVALTPASGGPDGTRRTHDGGRLALDALIAEDPEHCLGAPSVAEFGPRLPFLLKVLAAETPLSLQVHPTLRRPGKASPARMPPASPPPRRTATTRTTTTSRK